MGDSLPPARPATRGTTGRVVVAAAIVEHDALGPRVLGARRSAPPQLAGSWEFPGGKVEPGESDLAALVRECREELGVEVRPAERLGDEVDLPGGRVLRLWLAELVAGTPVALEHDMLRWFTAGELAEVPWLAPDLPLVDALATHLRALAAPEGAAPREGGPGG